ncbi:hypothetical protein D3C84_1083050 [compost metagenome]
MQYPPTAHDGQFPAQVTGAFQHTDLAPAGDQELRQFQPHQPPTNDGHALAQGHPDA